MKDLKVDLIEENWIPMSELVTKVNELIEKYNKLLDSLSIDELSGVEEDKAVPIDTEEIAGYEK